MKLLDAHATLDEMYKPEHKLVGEINKRAAGAYFSPRLFESDLVKHVVGFVQRFIP